MEEIITFDPTTEFQILETFDFEEETARGESVRFFTLEEQLNDYFELKAPKGKMTRFEMKELASQVDRIKDAQSLGHHFGSDSVARQNGDAEGFF
jgi:hypothetical protein